MLGEYAENLPSLAARSSSPTPAATAAAAAVEDEHPMTYTPYRDNPEQPPSPEVNDHELMQAQRQLMDDQDTRLDQLSHSINRQHDISININDELQVHHGLLESLDEELDHTEGRLSGARRGLDRFSRGMKGNGGTVTIALLIFVLLILIIVLKT